MSMYREFQTLVTELRCQAEHLCQFPEGGLYMSREFALVRTKIEEAEMWLERHLMEHAVKERELRAEQGPDE